MSKAEFGCVLEKKERMQGVVLRGYKAIPGVLEREAEKWFNSASIIRCQLVARTQPST